MWVSLLLSSGVGSVGTWVGFFVAGESLWESSQRFAFSDVCAFQKSSYPLNSSTFMVQPQTSIYFVRNRGAYVIRNFF